MVEYILVFITCFTGSLIQGTTGFGYAIFTMPVLSLFIYYRSVHALVRVTAFFMTLAMAYQLREKINYKVLLFPTISSLIGTSIGMYWLMTFDTDVLKMLLGAVIIVIGFYFAFYNDKIYIAPTPFNGILTGTLSGILGGMFNTGGPPLVIYYFAALKDKYSYTASLQVTFTIIGMYNILLHMAYGNIDTTVINLTGAGVIAVFLGGWAGLKIFDKLNKVALAKGINVFLFIMGLTLILQTLFN